MRNEEGRFIGMAPMALCDLKAAVRYLKANRDRIFGDADKIIRKSRSK